MIDPGIMDVLQDYDVMAPLLCSLAAGALIGAEREFSRKPAGIRTHSLLSFAAALMTLLGLRMHEWYVSLPEGMTMVTDMSRMPHAILTGVGFLGAGVILREGASVRGLTTAASLWMTAALGIVFGTGLIGLGLVGTAITVFILILLKVSQYFSPPAPFARLRVEVTPEAGMTAEKLRALIAAHGLGSSWVGLRAEAGSGQCRYDTLITMRKPLRFPQKLVEELSATEGIRSFALTPVLLDRYRAD